jgi:hypothetical protein
MPQTALPNIGLDYDWNLGEDGWKTGMDDNFALLDALAMPYTNFAMQSVSAQPGAPSSGDAYVLPGSGSITGADWAASPIRHNQYAVYYSNTGWHFAAPRDGWRVKDRTTGIWYEFYNDEWNAADLVSFHLACSDLASSIVAGSNVAYFDAPYPFEILETEITLLTASQSSPIPSPTDANDLLVDVNRNGTSIFGSTKMTITPGQVSSNEASPVAHTINLTTISKGQRITVDIDQAPPASPGGAIGLMVNIVGARKSQ